MELAVSGMNKLPRFRGTAYRVSVNVPPGYFAAVRPGAMLTDLAFSSASPSMTGVGNFQATQFGTKCIYYIIHTKTAVNIIRYAYSAMEGEVLFRPGTRFRVKAIWQHLDGKVPVNAPVAAQMVLHAMGEFKTDDGKTKAEWERAHKLTLAFAQGEDLEKARASKFGDDGLNRVKVIELSEV